MATGQCTHRLQLDSRWPQCMAASTNASACNAHQRREEGNPWHFQKADEGTRLLTPDALNRCLLPRQDVRTLDQRAKSSRCRFALLWPAATSAPVAPTKCGCLQCAEDAMPPVASFGHLASGLWLETPPKPNPTGYLSIQLQPAGSRAV